MGARAEPALRRALAGSPSAEAARRIEEVLAGARWAVLRLPVSGDVLHGVRAVEVLERAGTPEARDLLRAWAGQVRDPRLAAEAQATRDRTPHTWK